MKIQIESKKIIPHENVNQLLTHLLYIHDEFCDKDKAKVDASTCEM